jgi:hypothetical protein
VHRDRRDDEEDGERARREHWERPDDDPQSSECEKYAGGDHRQPGQWEPLELGVAGHPIDVGEVIQPREREDAAEEEATEKKEFAGERRIEL